MGKLNNKEVENEISYQIEDKDLNPDYSAKDETLNSKKKFLLIVGELF